MERIETTPCELIQSNTRSIRSDFSMHPLSPHCVCVSTHIMFRGFRLGRDLARMANRARGICSTHLLVVKNGLELSDRERAHILSLLVRQLAYAREIVATTARRCGRCLRRTAAGRGPRRASKCVRVLLRRSCVCTVAAVPRIAPRRTSIARIGIRWLRLRVRGRV